MEQDFENRYHHGSWGAGNRHDNEKRNDLRDGDFGREYENRYKNQDGRNRNEYNSYNGPGSLESNSYSNSLKIWDEDRSRRNYGSNQEPGSGYGYDSDRKGNTRPLGPRSQGGYGNGNMSGYSGSAFGGSNYSSKGNFSGNDAYGSMSGGGGNMGRDASSSGYGSSGSNVNRRNSLTGNNSPGSSNGNRTFNRRPDRGGYTDYDPNNRWNS